MEKPSFGDLVEVSMSSGRYVGILLPAPSLSDRETVVIKLDSGYNKGFEKKEVKGISVLEKRPQKTESRGGQKMVEGLPTVSILSTGGTISSRVDYRTGGVSASLSAGELLDSMPELKGGVNIRTVPVMNVMSEDMHPGLWVKLAEAVCNELNTGAQGVVVTHGTDTMSYSSAALSFLLKGSTKPVVFTGSQRSTDRGSSDGFMNLSCSISLAKSDCAGVYVCMHANMDDDYCLAHVGARVRKMHTSRRDAFKSINATAVARITAGDDPDFSWVPKPRGEGRAVVDGGFETNVGFIKAFPGMPEELIDFYIERGAKGIVFEGTALGHLPVGDSEHSVLSAVERAIDAGLVLAMGTQAIHGRVHPNVYSNLRELSSRGVVYCADMLAETAYVKLMWVLERTKDAEAAEKLLLEPVSCEISESSVIL